MGGISMLREMDYVYAVYQERSFSKAAKKLFVTQPALSRMVKKAEEEIGTPIFDRSTLPITVTKEGMKYIDAIEEIHRIEGNLKAYFHDLGELRAGRISLGGSSYFCSFILPPLISRFRKEHPEIAIELREGNVDDLKKGLLNETLDLVLETSWKGEPNIDTHLYKSEYIILAVPKEFEVNRKVRPYQLKREDIISGAFKKDSVEPVPLGIFRDVPFIKMKPGNDLYERSTRICANAGFEMNVVMYVDQIMTSLNIASTGIGAQFTRADHVRFLPRLDALSFYKLSDPLSIRNIYWLTKKRRYLSKAVREFMFLAGDGKYEAK